MSNDQPTKSNWAEKTSAVSNVLQNIQLQELHTTLRATGALQAEKLQLELNEQQVKDREDRLREHLWQMEQAFQGVLRDSAVTPCTTYILAKQAQGLLARFGVTTASFHLFNDKDRLGQFFNRLQQALEDSQNKLSVYQKSEAEQFLRYQSEAQSLEKAIADQQAAHQRRDNLRAKLKEWQQQKIGLARELQQLNESFTTQKQAEAAERPRPIRHAIKIVFAVPLGAIAVSSGLAAVVFILISLYDLGPGESWGNPLEPFGNAVLAGLVAILFAFPLGVMFPKRKSETIGQQIKALEAKISKTDAEIADVQSQITACGEEDEETKLAALLKQKQEREAFMLQFRQTNNLPLEDQSGVTSAMALPEVQALAHDPLQQKIAAIKLYREQNPGIGLAEAKEAVEALMDRSGANRQTDDPRQRDLWNLSQNK